MGFQIREAKRTQLAVKVLCAGSSGSGSSFSNLQPYITVYMWKRIS